MTYRCPQHCTGASACSLCSAHRWTSIALQLRQSGGTGWRAHLDARHAYGLFEANLEEGVGRSQSGRR
jgi:hypothetical protein